MNSFVSEFVGLFFCGCICVFSTTRLLITISSSRSIRSIRVVHVCVFVDRVDFGDSSFWKKNADKNILILVVFCVFTNTIVGSSRTKTRIFLVFTRTTMRSGFCFLGDSIIFMLYNCLRTFFVRLG